MRWLTDGAYKLYRLEAIQIHIRASCVHRHNLSAVDESWQLALILAWLHFVVRDLHLWLLRIHHEFILWLSLHLTLGEFSHLGWLGIVLAWIYGLWSSVFLRREIVLLVCEVLWFLLISILELVLLLSNIVALIIGVMLLPHLNLTELAPLNSI